MIHLFYFTSFVVALLLLPVQIHYYKKHASVYYVAFFISVMLCALGVLQISFATGTQAALFGNQVNYLGACFAPFFSLLCISDITKQKVPTFMKFLCFLIASTVFFFVAFTGRFPLYYKSVWVKQWHGASYLEKEYGPLHNLYLIYLVLISAGSIFLIVLAFKKRKNISYATSISLFFILVLSFITYIVQKAFHSKIDFIPFTMNLQQIWLLLLLNRISLYDISGLTASTMVESNFYGFVGFRDSGKYVGAEGNAEKWFPELNRLYVDKKISTELENESDFIKQVSKWINGEDSEKIFYFERDNLIIEAKYSIVVGRNGTKFHLIGLSDDTDQQKLNRLIKDYNENLEAKVNEKAEKIRQIQGDIIISMASIVENRDGNTGGHIKRTSDVVRIFVRELQKTGKFPELTPPVAACIIKAAPLHDFGKIGVPDVILNKPGKFTDEEYEIMKTHSEKGAHIVAQILQSSEDILFNNIAVNVAHFHHEKWNGTGYPKGLSEKVIPFEARIMALADVFDALVSRRVYKSQFSYDKAFGIIEESCGQHFDPDLCAEFLKCRPKLEKLYNSYGDKN